MDLSKLLATDTAVIQIKHPRTGAVIEGMTVTVAGNASEDFRRVRAELAKRRLETSRNVTVEELEASALTLLVACVKGWSGFEMDGVEYEFSPANARALLTNPGYFWLREQVESGVGDTANFIVG
jgi:hypothetical protein